MTEVVSENSEVTVLLVDDNPQNLKVLYETLKDQGYRLLIANEGEKALDLARRHQPEVVLLDIMMPEMDGYEV
ncbi:MAG: response regulator, partial [Marinobacter sp.]